MSVSTLEEFTLLGTPEFGTNDTSSSKVQLMHVEMSNDILEQLLESTRLGKVPKLQFGAHPVRPSTSATMQTISC
jgi:hypothetical protein